MSRSSSKPDEIPRLSKSEALVLRILIDCREAYGLDLVARSGGALKRGSVYVVLGRMEDKGLVEGRHEETSPSTGGLPRRQYRATGYGASVLTELERAAERIALARAAKGMA
jgi:DNA-binding PadR family transcriptional regulator